MQQYADAATVRRTRFVYTCIAGLVQLHVHDFTIPDANKLYTDAAGLAAPVRYLHQEACIAKTVLLHESVRVAHDKPPRAFSRGGTAPVAKGSLGSVFICSLGKGRKSWKFLHYLVWGNCGECGVASGERLGGWSARSKGGGSFKRCSSSSPTR